MKKFAEYIWTDGYTPSVNLRSKTRVIDFSNKETISVEDFPEWGFDGSSTRQAEGSDSDCVLKPVNFVKDPIRGEGNYLVLCEVFNRDGSAHETNSRAVLRDLLDNHNGANQDLVLGFEKEYVLYKDGNILGWPNEGEPGPQGPYYCAVGANNANGRELVEKHALACLDADLLLFGTNAEVMLGQWEYQIGYRGFDEDASALKVADHMMFAEWLIHRIAEEYNVVVNYDNKPIKGDWNGSGCHVNFSTKFTRDKETGGSEINRIIESFKEKHIKHIELYGEKLDERLTGAHETCSINEFRAGESDRGASIRIPVATSRKGYGYLEDRRPGANSNPYVVAARLLATICNVDESVLETVYKRFSSFTLVSI